MFTPEHPSSLRARLRTRWEQRTNAEAGFVLAFCALFMTILIGMGGFSVDLGNWYLHANRLQRTADAAALAGSVYLPNDFSKARDTAIATIDDNGDGGADEDITQSAVHPSQLNVAVTETVNNYFASIFGLKTTTISRHASAEYRPYVPMGSPSNVLGVEPTSSDSWEKASTLGLQNHYWLNIAGGSAYKDNGDRYSGGACNSNTDACAVGQPVPKGNADYSTEGQIYVVRIPDGTTGKVRIQAYDPVFANVGDHCDTNLTDADKVSSLYAAGDANTACTGDQMLGVTGSPPTSTTFQLWTPTEGGSKPIAVSGCSSQTYAGYNGSINNKVNPTKSTYDPVFTSQFRKWVTLCDINVGTAAGQYAPGDYLLHVTTPITGGGMNRFGLRVGAISSTGTLNTSKSANLSIFSQGRLVIYAHEQTGDVTFYLARIGSTAASHTITVTLFDIGDADGGANLQVLPPSDAKNNGTALTTFSGCTFTAPKSTVYKPTTTTCGINGMTSATYGGRVVNIQIPLPSGYTCKDADVNGCWTRLQLHYGAGKVADTTSWEVGLDGSPVRLVP